MRSPHLADWLYHLDSYTNAEFGRSRTLAAIHDSCVACGGPASDPDVSGLCWKCVAKRRSDNTEVILFRPLRRATAAPR